MSERIKSACSPPAQPSPAGRGSAARQGEAEGLRRGLSALTPSVCTSTPFVKRHGGICPLQPSPNPTKPRVLGAGHVHWLWETLRPRWAGLLGRSSSRALLCDWHWDTGKAQAVPVLWDTGSNTAPPHPGSRSSHVPYVPKATRCGRATCLPEHLSASRDCRPHPAE